MVVRVSKVASRCDTDRVLVTVTDSDEDLNMHVRAAVKLNPGTVSQSLLTVSPLRLTRAHCKQAARGASRDVTNTLISGRSRVRV